MIPLLVAPDLMHQACPQCHPGDYPAVLPFSVTLEGGSLLARYRHQACGTQWPCWWNPDAMEWPIATLGSPL